MSSVRDPNAELLAAMAVQLGDLRERFVFVGGCATGLLVTDPAAAPVRATRDVDVIVEAATLGDYYALGEMLRAAGFTQGLPDAAPPYRWRAGEMLLDVMPTDERILGFSNRWYRPAIETASRVTLTGGLAVRLVTAPYFAATKLEAFFGRGRNDYLASHDLEDLLTVVDGRPELGDEIAGSTANLRAYVAQTMKGLLADARFVEAIPAHVDFGSPQRSPLVIERLRRIAAG
jgi:predicted nucleotidyltransferase